MTLPMALDFLAQQAEQVRCALDAGHFPLDRMGSPELCRWSDSDKPIEQLAVVDADWPHLLIWDEMGRILDRLAQAVAGAAARQDELARARAARDPRVLKMDREMRKAGPQEVSDADKRRDLAHLRAALAWAQAGGAARYRLPEALARLPSVSAYDMACWVGSHQAHMMRRYIFDTPHGRAGVAIDATRIGVYARCQRGGALIRVELYGQSVSDTGYVSFRQGAAQAREQEHALMADPKGWALRAVEQVQRERLDRSAAARAAAAQAQAAAQAASAQTELF